MKAVSKLIERPGFWAGLMFGIYGAIAGLHINGVIAGTAATLLYVLPIGLLWPLYRSSQRTSQSNGMASRAIRTYHRRFLLATLGYLLGLGAAIVIQQSFNGSGELTTGLAFAIAVLPIIPVIGMIWAMARYLIEETDEYLRYRAAAASLFGLAALLVVACSWGFLELFGAVPHAPGWLSFPIWALAMGVAQHWMGRNSDADASNSAASEIAE